MHFYYFGFMWAIPMLVLDIYLFDKVLAYFGYHRMLYGDILLAYDGERRNSNIGVYAVIDKITHGEDLSKVTQRCISAIPNMRRVPVHALGIYLWKDVDVETAKTRIIKDDKELNSEKDVIEYSEKLINEELSRDAPMFEFRVVEDYTEDSSVIFYRSHHTFCDGVGISSLFSILNDDQFSAKYSKKIFKPSLFEQIWLFVTTPLGFKKFLEIVGSFASDKNAALLVKPTSKNFQGTKMFKSDVEVDFEIVRKCYRQYPGMTFNDLMIGVIGKSLQEEAQRQGIKDAKEIKTCIPISTRALPTGYHDLKVYNNVTAIAINLPLGISVEENMKKIKPTLKQLLEPSLTWQVVNYHSLVLPYGPAFFVRSETAAFGDGDDALFSNIPISQKQYSINGKTIRKFRLFNNVMWEYSLALFALTYANKVIFTTCVKRDLEFDGQYFQDQVMKNLQAEIEKIQA